jgi:hypothetical protein
MPKSRAFPPFRAAIDAFIVSHGEAIVPTTIVVALHREMQLYYDESQESQAEIIGLLNTACDELGSVPHVIYGARSALGKAHEYIAKLHKLAEEVAESAGDFDRIGGFCKKLSDKKELNWLNSDQNYFHTFTEKHTYLLFWLETLAKELKNALGIEISEENLDLGCDVTKPPPWEKRRLQRKKTQYRRPVLSQPTITTDLTNIPFSSTRVMEKLDTYRNTNRYWDAPQKIVSILPKTVSPPLSHYCKTF